MMKATYAFATLALLIWIIVGCAHKKPPAVPKDAPQDTTYTRQNESFDPLSLKDEDAMKLPDSRLKSSGGSSGGKASSRSGKGMREAAGFRVQLITTEQESDARDVEQKAMLDFTESVYLLFDPPNYKVRVGDCATRPVANELRDKAVRLGYNNAWVVQARVMLPGH